LNATNKCDRGTTDAFTGGIN